MEKSITAELAATEIFQAVTLDRVKAETGKDPLLMKLMDRIIKAGGTGSKSTIETWVGDLEDYKSIKEIYKSMMACFSINIDS